MPVSILPLAGDSRDRGEGDGLAEGKRAAGPARGSGGGTDKVIAHLGAPDFEDFIGLASSTPTVMLDTAMVFGGDAMLTEVPAWLVDKLGGLAGQIVFGSDFPTIPRPVSTQLAAIDGLGLGDEWLRAVLWRNGVRLLGIAGPDW